MKQALAILERKAKEAKDEFDKANVKYGNAAKQTMMMESKLEVMEMKAQTAASVLKRATAVYTRRAIKVTFVGGLPDGTIVAAGAGEEERDATQPTKDSVHFQIVTDHNDVTAVTGSSAMTQFDVLTMYRTKVVQAVESMDDNKEDSVRPEKFPMKASHKIELANRLGLSSYKQESFAKILAMLQTDEATWSLIMHVRETHNLGKLAMADIGEPKPPAEGPAKKLKRGKPGKVQDVTVVPEKKRAVESSVVNQIAETCFASLGTNTKLRQRLLLLLVRRDHDVWTKDAMNLGIDADPFLIAQKGHYPSVASMARMFASVKTRAAVRQCQRLLLGFAPMMSATQAKKDKTLYRSTTENQKHFKRLLPPAANQTKLEDAIVKDILEQTGKATVKGCVRTPAALCAHPKRQKTATARYDLSNAAAEAFVEVDRTENSVASLMGEFAVQLRRYLHPAGHMTKASELVEAMHRAMRALAGFCNTSLSRTISVKMNMLAGQVLQAAVQEAITDVDTARERHQLARNFDATPTLLHMMDLEADEVFEDNEAYADHVAQDMIVDNGEFRKKPIAQKRRRRKKRVAAAAEEDDAGDPEEQEVPGADSDSGAGGAPDAGEAKGARADSPGLVGANSAALRRLTETDMKLDGAGMEVEGENVVPDTGWLGVTLQLSGEVTPRKIRFRILCADALELDVVTAVSELTTVDAEAPSRCSLLFASVCYGLGMFDLDKAATTYAEMNRLMAQWQAVRAEDSVVQVFCEHWSLLPTAAAIARVSNAPPGKANDKDEQMDEGDEGEDEADPEADSDGLEADTPGIDRLLAVVRARDVTAGALVDPDAYVKGAVSMGYKSNHQSFVVGIKTKSGRRNPDRVHIPLEFRTTAQPYSMLRGGNAALKLDNEVLNRAQTVVGVPLSALESFTTAGDLVYNPFGGTGECVEACVLSGRSVLYVDKDPKQCRGAVKRMISVLQKLPLAGAVNVRELHPVHQSKLNVVDTGRTLTYLHNKAITAAGGTPALSAQERRVVERYKAMVPHDDEEAQKDLQAILDGGNGAAPPGGDVNQEVLQVLQDYKLLADQFLLGERDPEGGNARLRLNEEARAAEVERVTTITARCELIRQRRAVQEAKEKNKENELKMARLRAQVAAAKPGGQDLGVLHMGIGQGAGAGEGEAEEGGEKAAVPKDKDAEEEDEDAEKEDEDGEGSKPAAAEEANAEAQKDKDAENEDEDGEGSKPAAAEEANAEAQKDKDAEKEDEDGEGSKPAAAEEANAEAQKDKDAEKEDEDGEGSKPAAAEEANAEAQKDKDAEDGKQEGNEGKKDKDAEEEEEDEDEDEEEVSEKTRGGPSGKGDDGSGPSGGGGASGGGVAPSAGPAPSGGPPAPASSTRRTRSSSRGRETARSSRGREKTRRTGPGLFPGDPLPMVAEEKTRPRQNRVWHGEKAAGSAERTVRRSRFTTRR